MHWYLKVEMQNRMDKVMHVHVHGNVDEFSKTGAKSRASVIDSAKIMLFPAKDAVKMPKSQCFLSSTGVLEWFN